MVVVGGSLEAGRVAVSSETRLGPCGTPAPVALEASADLHHTDGIWWQSHERATGPAATIDRIPEKVVASDAPWLR